MVQQTPSTCPNCGEIQLAIAQVPPQDHSHGDQWITRVDCPSCEYIDRFQ